MIGAVLKFALRVCGAAACLLCAGLAGLLGWAGASGTGEGSAAVLAATGYSRALYREIETARAEDAGRIADMDGELRELLRRAPLLDTPLSLRGLKAFEAGRQEEADRAFGAAFARNPRSVPGRVWLINRALQAGDVDRAVGLVSGLFAIKPDDAEVYTDALASIASLPGGLSSLTRRLSAAPAPPSWAGAVVTRINALTPDPDRLIGLNRITPQTQDAFIARILEQRGVRAAFEVWRSFTPEAGEGDVAWPYDGRFTRRPGPAPFNWQSRSDLIEFTPGGGLSVSYLGRGRPVLLEQLMMLGPGDYTLSTTLSGEASAQGGGLSWSIACSPSDLELGRLALRELSRSTSRRTLTFTVSGDQCVAQRLVLRGEPGEFPTRARAEIASVQIAPQAPGAQP